METQNARRVIWFGIRNMCCTMDMASLCCILASGIISGWDFYGPLNCGTYNVRKIFFFVFVLVILPFF